MKHTHILLLFTVFFTLLSRGQITIIGHPKLNNTPVSATDVVVKDGDAVIKTLNTQKKSEFMLKLDFGKVYKIYVQHAGSPVMFFEVKADNIPQDKYDYRMTYALDVPFCNSNDNDIDTTVFKDPFHKVIFDGKNSLKDDADYNSRFAKSILKKAQPAAAVKTETKPDVKPESAVPEKEQPTFIAGSVMLNDDAKLPADNKIISIINKSGKVIKSTSTNRNGAFAFSDVLVSEVAKLRLDVKSTDAGNGSYSLASPRHGIIARAKPVGEACEWPLTPEEVSNLTDHHYSTNLGGKLVSASPKEKKFFAGKTVYLSNKFNTVLKQTKTNLFGTFVFEDIKPDNNYFIGVDRTDIGPGEKIDLLNKEDGYITTLDTIAGGRASMKLSSAATDKTFNDLSIGDGDVKMDIKATIFGDNVNTPIGKLKIILLNDQYQVIDSVLTDNLGTFKFKYLPFLKRFYLSAENTDNILDVFKNILIYSSDDNLIKIMTHQKGTKFSYKPVNAEMSRLRDIELDDPWLEFVGDKKTSPSAGVNILGKAEPKSIVENILFENNKYEITLPSKEILDKIILVLNTNKNLKIEIGAHTDSKGSAAANLKLSQMRAKTVQDYITSAGIDAKRIISKGYGETKLRNKCDDNHTCSEEEHAQNRRIEFKILGE
jgi:outer membrane protein OmpA-like peptidoglycan-associated protein